MLIKKPDGFKPSEITPEAVYLQRRAFIRGAGLGLGAMLLPGMGMAAIDANVPVRDITRYTGARQASTLVPDWLHKKVSQAQPSRHLAQEAVTSSFHRLAKAWKAQFVAIYVSLALFA